jgi:PAS domain S-box-containing protein
MLMPPTYEEMENKVRALERQASARNRTEELLRESKEKYRCVVENVNVGLLVVQDLKVVFGNDAISTYMDHTKEELINNPNPFEFIHPDDVGMVFERHIKRLNNEPVEDVYPFRVVTKDGRILWLEITPIKIYWNGEPATLNFLTDITERVHAEEEREKLIHKLEEALKELKTLRGILPLCSFCKKIRDDKGYWERVDVYIHKYLKTDISHGICPECAKKHTPF